MLMSQGARSAGVIGCPNLGASAASATLRPSASAVVKANTSRIDMAHLAHCEQRRGLGRARVVGVVGMERLTRNNVFAVHDLVIGNVFHVGMAGDVPLFFVVRMKLAE